MVIKENFLNIEENKNILSHLDSMEFPWYLRFYFTDPEDKGTYFTHSFYNNHTVASPQYELIIPILRKLDPASIIEARVNMTLISNTQFETKNHVDFEYKNFKTAIYYVNDNNGGTNIGGKEISSKANTLVIFDGNTPHRMISHTDIDRRFVININYFEK